MEVYKDDQTLPNFLSASFCGSGSNNNCIFLNLSHFFSGLLKPHAKKCKCSLCSEILRPPISNIKALNLTVKENNIVKQTKNVIEQETHIEKDEDTVKEKPLKRRKIEEEETKKIKDEKTKKIRNLKDEVEPVTDNPEKNNPTEESSFTSSRQASPRLQTFKMFSTLSPPTLITTNPSNSAPRTTVSSISTASTSLTDAHSPPFISLSTAPQMISSKSSSLGSSMMTFTTKLAGISSSDNVCSSAKSILTNTQTNTFITSSSQSADDNTNQSTSLTASQPKQEEPPPLPTSAVKSQISIKMGPPKMESNMICGLSQNPIGAYPLHSSRLGAVMQVRCKAVAAFLYVNKYESGSKGKCILLGDEWLTPNEFEEKSGSKAKKYLSSIKCLGRPLRSFVNSGELRGSGPPPSPKPPRMSKAKPPQPIAPAPAPGQVNIAQMGMSSIGMNSNNLPQSLPVAMMGNVSIGGQPILINQQSYSVANSITNTSLGQSSQLGNQILAPMTFTLSPVPGIDVRQSVGLQQQMHGSQHI